MKEMICVYNCTREKLELIKKAGFELVEICFNELGMKSDADAKAYLEMFEEIGLTPAAANGFYPGCFKGFFDKEFDIGAIREYMAIAFEKSAKLNLSSIAYGSGFMRKIPEGRTYDEMFNFFAEFLSTEVVPYLEKYDRYLNIEELNSKETNFLNSCTETAKLIETVNHPRVGLLCDFYHMSLAGETHLDFPKFAKYIGHVHIASPSNSRAIPFENDGDNEKYTAFFKSLKDCGYKTGYVSLEGGVPDGLDYGKAVADSCAYLKKEFANM